MMTKEEVEIWAYANAGKRVRFKDGSRPINNEYRIGGLDARHGGQLLVSRIGARPVDMYPGFIQLFEGAACGVWASPEELELIELSQNRNMRVTKGLEVLERVEKEIRNRGQF